MDIFARITMSYNDLKTFFESFAQVCEKIVVYEHDTSRKHCHFYAVGCSLKTDAIKVRIKKHLHVTEFNKSNWSFKTAVDDGCIVYMTKGILDPVFVKGFEGSELCEYRSRWVPKERAVVKDVIKKDTVTQFQMAMEVYDMINETANVSDMNEYDLYRLCVRTAIKICFKYKKGFDDNSIRKIVHPAYVKIYNMEDTYVEKVTKRFFS